MLWETFTLYPGYTFQVSDGLVVLGVVIAVVPVALIVGRMFRAP